MREFQDKKQRQRIIFSPITVGVLVIAVILMGRGVWNILQKNTTAREARISAEARVAELELKKERLSADITRLGTPKGIEEEIRNKFPVVKEGEELVIIVPPEEKNNEESGEIERKGFFDFVKNIF